MSQPLRDRFFACYVPRVAAFAEEVASVHAAGMPEPHLPFFGVNYEQATLRMAVVGRDTKQWHRMDNFLRTASVDPAVALQRHRADFDGFRFLDWRCYRSGRSFWATLLKLVAGFHGINDWKSLLRCEHPEVLRSFVWAQTNSIEHFASTAKALGVNRQHWLKFKTASERQFDSLSLLLDTFQPHVTIVMSRSVRPEYWDRHLSWQSVTDHLECSRDEASGGGLIFRTAHPGWLSRKGLYKPTLAAIFERWKAEAPAKPASAVEGLQT